MTISDTATKFRYEGNGVTDTFAFSGKAFTAADLVVEIITRATDALEETLTITTHYSVTIATDGTASIVTVAGKIPSATQDIQIRRSLAQTQSTVLPTGTKFPAKSVENAIDRAVGLSQDLEEAVNRSLKFPATSSTTVATLPEPIDDAILCFDGTTGAFKTGELNATITANTTAAAASATAAAASATAASASASAASNSETAAAASALAAAVAASDLNQTYVVARHRRLADKLSQYHSSENIGFLSGLSIGNSITQGTGTSGFTYTYSYRLGQYLADWFGYGTISDWDANNYGVGSGDLSTCAGYIAHDGDYETADMIQRGADLPNRDYVLLMSLRNDVTNLTVAEYTDLLRAVLRNIMNSGIDVIFITEPPKINTSTGAITDDDDNWTPWYEAALRICAEEGATVVDEWKYWVDQAANGYNLTTRTSDGVHYDDTTHEHIASQILVALKTPVESQPYFRDGALLTEGGRATIVGKYVDSAATATGAISGLTTSGTGRFIVKGEGTKEAYTIASGNTLSFKCPIPCRGIILTMVGGSSNTGTASVTYPAGTAVQGGTGLGGGSTVREKTYWLPLNSFDANASFQYGVAEENCRVTAVGGQIQITSVLFVGANLTSYNTPAANAVEVGTWSDSTLPNGNAARTSSTISDTYTYRFYGTGMNLRYQRGTDQGKFGWTIDGGGSTTVDCYLNAAATTQDLMSIKNLSRGWHTLELTIETKNAASSANNVEFGDFIVYDEEPKAATQYIEMQDGETYYLPEYWERAIIHEVISGTPLPPDFAAGDETITLRGSSCSAVVRLER